jgi:hypothetical protein
MYKHPLSDHSIEAISKLTEVAEERRRKKKATIMSKKAKKGKPSVKAGKVAALVAEGAAVGIY